MQGQTECICGGGADRCGIAKMQKLHVLLELLEESLSLAQRLYGGEMSGEPGSL